MGRKKRKVRSNHPPSFFKVSPVFFSQVRDGLFGKRGLWATYLLILDLSWDGQGCDWTNEMIAGELGISLRGVEKHVAELKGRGLIEVEPSPDGRRLLVPTVRFEDSQVTPNVRSVDIPNEDSAESSFGSISHVEETTRVGTEKGGGVMSNPVLDINNTTRASITPPPDLKSREGDRGAGEGGEAITPNVHSVNEHSAERVFGIKRQDGITPNRGSGEHTFGINDRAHEITPNRSSAERVFGKIHPAFPELAKIIGLTTPASVRLMADAATAARIGPRRLLALWRNVQESGGGKGAFVHRLKSGLDPGLLPEPDYETPGFCPVCGAEVGENEMRYAAPECPNGHELRVCNACGELAPAGEACPWCGAEAELDEDAEAEPDDAAEAAFPEYDRREEAEGLWREALKSLSARFYHAEFDRLFAGTVGVGFDGERLVVRAPDGYSGIWLSGRLHEKVLDVVKSIEPEVSKIEFVWNGREHREVNA